MLVGAFQVTTMATMFFEDGWLDEETRAKANECTLVIESLEEIMLEIGGVSEV